MFVTHEALKHPVQLDRESTAWRGIELALHHPMFLVTCFSSDDDASRTFLLHGTIELNEFANKTPAGKITDLHLLQPPWWSGSSGWAIKRMSEILLQEAPPDGSIPSAVTRGEDGALYGGFPIAQIKGNPGPLSMLAALPN
ncbi:MULTISPECIES: hypothetical protein [Ramlibacter]|uniref:Uncharacterized protein n=1 Tax=Ramlibacter pinisoli TaxID=2682844 RepID=A0A6N8ISU3_9BURK|nr:MULTISPECIES: hypothetical protein [Ramlibacter]MBA2964679.1 hypothetical protein [Ramlibacter sp. CGMCC 1.13660]MVQ29645.1 hypothetical protein [Ramlibacter pinisoli]